MDNDKGADLIATCAGGLEGVLKEEIQALGWTVTDTVAGGVRFLGNKHILEVANRNVRTASRILVSVVTGRVKDGRDAYRLVSTVPWERLIPSGATIAVSTTGRNGSADDPRFLTLKVKDAIVDRQRKHTGRRSSVDKDSPDVSLVLHLSGDNGELSIDSSGAPLHERGYRTQAGEAPLRETLAAGMVLLSRWTADRVFLDPFCGSGTIAIEAAMIAAGRYPGSIGRRYAYERWPASIERLLADRRRADTGKSTILIKRAGTAASRTADMATSGGAGATSSAAPNAVPSATTGTSAPANSGTPGTANSDRVPSVATGRSALENAPTPSRSSHVAPHPGTVIVASDHDPQMVTIARANAARAGVQDLIRFEQKDFRERVPESSSGVLVTNPPYGERLKPEDIRALYREFGRTLKDRFAGWDAWVISSNSDAIKSVGLRAGERIRLFNGGLESRFVHFPIYR